MWANFHTHTVYCDGKAPFQDYFVEPLVSLGFSSHAPLPFPSPWCMKPQDLARYFKEIDQLKSTHEVYAGLEVDFIPEVISPADFPQVDYTIGSVHFVDSFDHGQRWEIDGLHTLFLEGLEQIFRNNIKDVIVRYYELTRAMLEKSPPTILGHLDKIKIQNPGDKFFSEHDAWYREEIKKVVATLKNTNTLVEVNTRGLYQKKSLTTYPSPWVLELIHAAHLPVTISSDAHHPRDLVNEFSTAASMLQHIGFKKIHILHEGAWKEVTFNENGILL